METNLCTTRRKGTPRGFGEISLVEQKISFQMICYNQINIKEVIKEVLMIKDK